MADDLYKRIGGSEAILASVDVFYRMVLADAALRPFFDGAKMDRLAGRQAMFISMLLGVRGNDAEENIKKAHAGSRLLGLNDSHFDLMMKYFRASMEEVKMPADAIDQIMVKLQGTRGAVLDQKARSGLEETR